MVSGFEKQSPRSAELAPQSRLVSMGAEEAAIRGVT